MQISLDELGQLYERGDLVSLENCAREFCEKHPSVAMAWYLRGLSALKQAQYLEAERFFRSAINACSTIVPADYQWNLGEALRFQQRTREACEAYTACCSLDPQHFMAHRTLGLLHLTENSPQQARAYLEVALRSCPGDPGVLVDLGVACQHSGDTPSAEAYFRQAIAVRPDFTEAYMNLGLLNFKLGKSEQALTYMHHAAMNAGNSFATQFRLGTILQQYGHVSYAIQLFRHCQRLSAKTEKPFERTQLHLAECLAQQGNAKEAESIVEQLLKSDSCELGFWQRVGQICKTIKSTAQAMVAFARSVELHPDSLAAVGALWHESLNCCEWSQIDQLSQCVYQAVESGSSEVPPFSPLMLGCSPALQAQCAQAWVKSRFPKKPAAMLFSERLPGKIRVGYFSSDFFDHATTRLIIEALEKHDHERFEVIGYSYSPLYESPMRDRVIAAFDRFNDVRALSNQAIADLIRQDGIDILVDLKGHTQGSRLSALSLRCAPIQVHFLGYPGTTGTDFIDYLLVDKISVPHCQQPYFSERLVHLEGCYQPNDSHRTRPPCTLTRNDCGLPQTGVVYCCFNNSYKITPNVFDVWMRILREVQESVLWLLEDNALATNNLKAEAAKRDIDPSRLVFAPRRRYNEYLSRYHVADLFLDTHPVCAHTTASDALWMACPLITQLGETFVSRVSASLLHSVGLEKLIVDDLEAYVSLAIELGHDIQQLAVLRQHLQAVHTQISLFDGGSFARKLELAYQAMFQRWQAGLPPQPLG